MATLTYVYVESTALVGPLAEAPEPHTYDLCERHARGLTAPRGWRLVRPEEEFIAGPAQATPGHGSAHDCARRPDHHSVPDACYDDLVALAEAVREGGRPGRARPADGATTGRSASGVRSRPRVPAGRRGHLRAVPPIV